MASGTENQITAVVTGTILGAILGFGVSEMHQFLQRRRQHRAFRKVLQKEIEQLAVRLESHRNILIECHNEIMERRLSPQNFIDRFKKMNLYSIEYPTGIFKNNLDKLLPFSEKVIGEIVAFYALVDECQHKMSTLELECPQGEFIPPPRIPKGEIKYPDGLRKINIMLSGAVQKGKDVLAKFSAESDQEWTFEELLAFLKAKAWDIVSRVRKHNQH
jgi:hypothetical protein